MEKIDYSRYVDNYSPERFHEKVTRVARRLGRRVVRPLVLLYCALRYGELSTMQKMKVIGMLGYFILPTDFLPDFIAGIGYGDDLLGAMYLLRKLHKSITPEVKQAADELLDRWLGEN